MSKSRTLLYLLSVLVILTVISVACSGKKEQTEAPAGMHALNLTRYGKPFYIFVPDTIAAKLTVTEQISGALQIRVGKSFGIAINEQFADLNLLKEDLKNDDVNKLKKIHQDDASGILWESEIVSPEFHFMLNRKIGDREYSFEDIRESQSNPFSKEAIEKMFDSAKNAMPVNKEANS